MRTIKMGVIGLGGRGQGLSNTILACEEADIVAVCDLYPDRVDAGAKIVSDKRGHDVAKYTDYKELLKNPEVQAVLVSTAWETHIKIAIDSMKAGKITAIEVGGAYDIQECWDLVRTYEETGTPFMMMENCCFDKFELLALSLVRAGKLGEIVHCHGAYGHDLRDEITGGYVNRHYRLRNYKTRNCENYPTHELGPIAKILNINRGNQMVSLVSVASKSAGLKAFAKTDKCPDPTVRDYEWTQGDIVETIITCAGGETISLKLDTTLPRFYSREFTVRGTKGMAYAEPNMVIIDGECNTHAYAENCNNATKYEDYLPAVWKNITKEELELGHGGMDYLEFKAFFKAILNNEEMPLDVYDAAAWMAVTALSEKSIAAGGAPQAFPDFTGGLWVIREPKDVTELPSAF